MNKMHFRLLIPVLLLFAIMTAAYAFNDPPKADEQIALKVHEWGTFTSIAGENGAAVSWQPFGGPADLPCFVNRFSKLQRQHTRYGKDGNPRPLLLWLARLDGECEGSFPEERHHRVVSQSDRQPENDSIEWRDVRISPNAAPEFPVERGQSHYYAARKTDSAPLQVGSQNEKFLFYRGVGTFPLPISAKSMADSRILVKNLGTDAVGGLILFENRGGKLRYEAAGTLRNEIALHLESQQNSLKALLADLERILVARDSTRKKPRP